MKTQTFASVWDAIEATPAEAANMKVRAQLLMELQRVIRERGWTQVEASKSLGVTQPRVSDIMRGKIGLFSIDKLVVLLSMAGETIELRTGTAA